MRSLEKLSYTKVNHAISQEATMAKLCVPDHTGHKEYDFTPNSPAAKRAEKIFNRFMDKGYVGGKRMADGSLKKIRKVRSYRGLWFISLRSTDTSIVRLLTW